MISFKKYAVLAVSIATLSIAPQAFAAPDAEEAAAKEESGNSADKMICRKVEVVGSRLRSERVCMSSSEWAAKKQQDRQALELRQTTQYKNN